MRILVIAPRFPWPLEKGDKLRLYQQIRYLSLHHEVFVFALTHSSISSDAAAAIQLVCKSFKIYRLSPWKIPINLVWGLLQGLPMSVSYFTDSKAKKEFRLWAEEVQPDVIYGQLARIGEYLKVTDGMRIMDVMDAFSEIANQKAYWSNFFLKPLYFFESLLLKRYEQGIPEYTHGQVFISQRDREMLDPTHLWPAIIVPNGIDLEFFKISSKPLPTYDILFVGNLGYFPNITAVRYLVKQIMPIIWAEMPNARVLIAGARPSASVLQLRQKQVTIHGWVSDIREAYSAARIFIAPIFQGAGMQNKILEAMAMNLPVITTPHVNKAIAGIPNESILLAETPQSFAKQALDLMRDPPFANQIAEAGNIFVHKNYNWADSVNHLVKNSFEPTLHKHAADKQ